MKKTQLSFSYRESSSKSSSEKLDSNEKTSESHYVNKIGIKRNYRLHLKSHVIGWYP